MANRDLRIDGVKAIAMLGIVMLHAIGYGDVWANDVSLMSMRPVMYVLHCICFAMTNVFVIVSASFLIHKSPNPKKLWKIVKKSSIYATAIYLLFYMCGFMAFSPIELIKNIFAIFTNQFWFISAYAVMFLLAPYLNILLKAINEKQLQWLLIVMLSITTLIPSVLIPMPLGAMIAPNPGMTFIWFVTLYILVYYMQCYKHNYSNKLNLTKEALIAILCIIALVASRIALEYLSERLGMGGKGALRLYFNSSIPVAILSICIYLMALRIPQLSSNWKWRSWISASTLGIYVLTEQPQMRSFIWGYVHDIYVASSPLLLPLVVIGCSMVVFTFALTVDKCYDYTVAFISKAIVKK